jgi:hypothetical protein
VTVAFGISYTLTNRRVVRFAVPLWLVIRAKRKSPEDLQGEPLPAGEAISPCRSRGRSPQCGNASTKALKGG